MAEGSCRNLATGDAASCISVETKFEKDREHSVEDKMTNKSLQNR